MSFLKSFGLFLICLAGLSAALWLFGQEEMPAPVAESIIPPAPQNNQSQSLENSSTNAKETEESLQVPQQPSTLNSHCQPSESVLTLQKDPAIRHWIQTNIGYGVEDAENYMDMNVLLEQAEAGNAYAMLVKGLHHLHRAQYDAEYDPWMRPDVDAKNAYRKKPLDLSELKQAEHWLKTAGYHGKLGVFGELSKVYFAYWRHAKEQGNKLDEELWLIKANAIMVFQGRILPEYFSQQIYGYPDTATEDIKRRLDLELEDMQHRWRMGREALGLSVDVQKDIPADVKEYVAGMNCLTKP